MESYLLLLSSERVIEEGEKREQRKKQAKRKCPFFRARNSRLSSSSSSKKTLFQSRFRFLFRLLSSVQQHSRLLFDFTNTMGLRASKPKDTANGTAHQHPQTPGGLRVRRFELFFPSLSLSLSLSLESEIVSFFFEMFSDALSYFSLTTHKAHE